LPSGAQARMPMNESPRDLVQPAGVRYIKLGQGGAWEAECLQNGIVRLGFGSAGPGRLGLCRAGRWNELLQSFMDAGKSPTVARRFTNETRVFFEDDGSLLWITFVGQQLCWGQLTKAPAEPHADGDGVWRSVAGGWKKEDANGDPLTKDRLSGALNKLAAYRGTSCDVSVADYVIRRINGRKLPQVELAERRMEETAGAALDLMRLLGPQDFEMLVDLVFTTTGWRRLGVVGKTQKTLDLDLLSPSTGERAFVQVKSKTSSGQLAEYVERLDTLGPYDRMFFVFHSGDARTGDPRVTVIGPEKLADLVIDAGLMRWLIRKVS
jgi:hypothetical protein